MATKKRKTKKPLTGKALQRKLIELTRKHGQVKLISRGSHNDMRARRIKKNGRCDVAYKSNGYPKYTRYSGSCFVPYNYTADGNATKPRGLKQTVEALFCHDSTWMRPIEIQYGKRFKRKIKLCDD